MIAYPFLQTNLTALERLNPSVHQWLKDHLSSLGPSEKLVMNRRGFLDWMMPTGKGLFGTFSAARAYKNWRLPEGKETGTTIVIGCNLGYGLNHLLPKLPSDHQVLVLEPRAELLLACLGHTDYRPFLETGRLLFLPAEIDRVREILCRLVLPCLFGRITLRADLPSLQLGPEYAIWMDHCKEILDDLRINAQTFRSHQDRAIVNEMRNLRRVSCERSLAALQGKARGITGVVLGAGPSLERFAPVLRQYHERAIFSTSFQALPVLQRLGLKPHFAMIVDSNPFLLKVYERLDSEWASTIPLVYSTTVCPEVVEGYPGPTIPLWTIAGLACRFSGGKEPVFDMGGNVGVGLVRFLRWCGTDRVLLVGQDFSWVGTKTHAEGHPAGGRDFHFDPRIHLKMKNRMGQDVFTCQPYLTPLRELERDLQATSAPVFDLYGGGLPIQGSESIGLEDLETKVISNCDAAKVKRFMRTLERGLSPAKPIFQWNEHNDWRRFLRAARQNLGVFSVMPSLNRADVVPVLDEILRYLQQDPLSGPYLMNEVISLAGIIYRTKDFGSTELRQCMEYIDRAAEKMGEMERCFRGDENNVPENGICADQAITRMAAA